MYGQGNYGPQAGQVSYSSVPSHLLPPPPPLPSQPAHSAPRQPVIQSSPQSVQNFPPPSALPPPPPVQGHQWSPNVHHILPSMAPGAPRVFLPPPPPYGGSAHMPLPSTGLPPPPPPSFPVRAPPIPQSSPSPIPPAPKSCNLANALERGSSMPTSSTVDGAAFGLVDNHLASVCKYGGPQNEYAGDNNNSSMGVPAIYSSLQSTDSVDAGASYSPNNSDMEMEDDITQPEEEQKAHLFDTSYMERVSLLINLDAEEQSQGAVGTVECGLAENVVEDQSQGRYESLYLSHSIAKKSSPRPNQSVTSAFRDSSPIHENSHQFNPKTSSEKCSSQLAEGPSPFSLIQGYASDDSLDNYNNDDRAIQVENVRSQSTEVQTIVNEDAGKLPECSPSSQRVVRETDRTSNVAEKSTDASSGTANEGDGQKNAPRDENTNANLPREDVKYTSGSLKIDEYGRLAREGGSDSDSGDSPRYTRRRGKRVKSRSRSRSPYDRRRWSPRGRKDKRRRSRSASPKRRRSRSSSPFRHRFGGDKMRRGKNQLSECFDFKKGRCYRGASCRYSHHESDKSDRSNSYRSKEQHRVHENNKTKREELRLRDEIHDVGEKKAVESESVSHIHGKESCTEPSGSPLTRVKPEKHSGDAATTVPSFVENAVTWQSQSQKSDHEPKLIADSSISVSSTLQTSTSIPLQHPQFLDPKELSAPNVQLPSCFPPLSHAPITSSAQQMLGENNIMQQFNSAYIEHRPPYQPLLPPQQPHFSAPLNISWNSLPLTMPPPNPSHLSFVNNAFGNAALGHYGATPAQFQQNVQLPRNDFVSQNSVRPYQNALPGISQVGQHQAYMHAQPISSMGSPSKKFQTLPGDPLPPRELPVPSSKGYSYMQQLPCVPNHSEAAGASVYTSDFPDMNREPCLSGFGGSKTSSYFNPYASTFVQPLTTVDRKCMLSSERNGASFSLQNAPVDGRPVESLGSRNTPPHSLCAANRMLSMPGDNRYDPLFDSMEPSTNSFQNSGPAQKTTIDSGVMLRLSRWDNPLDVEENNMQKGGGTIAIAASAGNDEYGETADAEVGALEDGSPSDSNDVADMAEEEVEIDQVNTSGKNNKGKDSRSSRLFKNCIANFVKELLKPSWRQGNMSKEVFKTIVKKTVEKVSGAMKRDKIPKSQAKIDRYIDSSQRKLTKLVMGYVDKYVKA